MDFTVKTSGLKNCLFIIERLQICSSYGKLHIEETLRRRAKSNEPIQSYHTIWTDRVMRKFLQRRHFFKLLIKIYLRHS